MYLAEKILHQSYLHVMENGQFLSIKRNRNDVAKLPFSNFLCLQTNCAVYLQPKHHIRGFPVTILSWKLIM